MVEKRSQLKMILRKSDETDRRSVLVQRTVRGSIFLREYSEIVASVAVALPA